MRSLPDEARSGLDRWDLIGVVSFGPRLCGTEGVPGVSTEHCCSQSKHSYITDHGGFKANKVGPAMIWKAAPGSERPIIGKKTDLSPKK